MNKKKIYICDLDGTVCLHTHRSPYDEMRCDTDEPNHFVVENIKQLYTHGSHIIFLSGRHECSRQKSEEWIHKYINIESPELYMRADGDNRPDTVIKEELYLAHIEPYYEVTMVYDDRTKVVDMWRNKLGLPCFQVVTPKEGDF